MINTPKIHWMLDESIAHSRPTEWGRIISLEKELVNMIGNPNFEHVFPNPIEGLSVIFDQIQHQKYTTIMDLTGWLSPSLKCLFPSTPIINQFSLSRVRVVSSPNLETSGYTVSMNCNEIYQQKQQLDMDRTLIVDDTTFTGWTSLKTMEMWNLNPNSTTHAFLIANTGKLDIINNVNGAVANLENHGSTVIFGHELVTPNEDGWHLKDLHQHKNIGDAFDMGLTILKLIENEGPESEIVKSTLQGEAVLNTIFPDRFTPRMIKELIENEKFIPSGKVDLEDGNLVHTKNPLLWSSRYFREHIDLPKIMNNRIKIKSVLSELHTLTDDPEARNEAAIELKNIVQNKIQVEGGRRAGQER
jgi:hypothetical protein